MHADIVPVRALTMTLVAVTGAVGAAVFWPQLLAEQEMIAGGLALGPALLLAHYRNWPRVMLLLGIGLVALIAAHLLGVGSGSSLSGSSLVLFVLGPYITVTLGAGWFGEIRKYQAELQATQLQLIQAEKLESIGRMAAGVAHEVKNPLMIILTGVKILSRRIEGGDVQTQQLLQDMSDAVGRADKIIGGLLSYARDRDLEVKPADLNATIESSLLLVRHAIDKGQVAVRTELDPTLPAVRLDEFKIQQVFVNLLTNALHAMEHTGTIAVRTSHQVDRRGQGVGRRLSDRFVPGERVAIVTIDDSGPGIPEAHLRKVFDPFFTTKPTGVGTGLGLAISRQIVEMHGGLIEIGNREAGGARVTMMFKLAQERSAT